MAQPVVHFEIGCRDRDRTDAFYSSLFGWSTTDYGPLSRQVDTGSDRGIPGYITALGHVPHNYIMFYVEVDDIVNVTAIVRYFGSPGDSGMMIVDIGVPTGFAPVSESLDALVDANLVSKVEVAGRKVILYVDGLTGGEERSLTFQVIARFPVRAVVPDSKAYVYYEPDIRAEDAGEEITVGMPICIVNFRHLAMFADGWLKSDPDFGGRIDFSALEELLDGWLDVCPPE